MNKRIEELAREICQEHDLELYDIEFKNTDKGKVLRVYVTSPEGVKLDDCSSISRKLSNELDVIDLISSRYTLEVSSPGLERALTKDSHYRGAIGETVKITFRKGDKNLTHTGILKEVTHIGLTIGDDDTSETNDQLYPFDSIKKIRTVFIFNQKSRR